MRFACRLTTLLLPCLAFLLGSQLCFAQADRSRLEHHAMEQGLPSNVIYSIIQDSRGFLWIGTNEGLSRYDGYQFRNFRHDRADTNSIPGHQVFSVLEHRNGMIWATTSGGTCRYDRATNRFSRVTNSDAKRIIPLSGNQILLVDSGAHLLDTRTYERRTVMKTAGVRVEDGWQAADGSLYLLLANFWENGAPTNYPKSLIHKYDPQRVQLIESLSLVFPFRLKGEVAMSCFTDSRGTRWVGTNPTGKICRWDQDHQDGTGNEIVVLDDLQGVRQIMEDQTGHIWFATSRGAYMYDYGTGRLNKMLDEAATCIFQDRTGVIWIGTYTGLYQLNSGRYRFRHLTASGKDGAGLLNDFVLGIRQLPDRRVFVRYYWGERRFSLFDPSLRTVRHHSSTDFSHLEATRLFAIRNPDLLNEDSLKQFAEIVEGMLPKLDENSFLFFDRKGQLWLMNNDQLYLLNAAQTEGIKLQADVADAALFGDEIWIASFSKGLLAVNTSTLQVRTYAASPTDKNSIGSNGLNCLLIEKNGDIWIGSKGAGLDHFDRKKNRFLHYSTKDGLPNNSIFSLVMDDRNRLWIGTGNGLSCLDADRKTFTNFHQSDGLINSEYNRFSACRLLSGHILMGGMKGIDYFHPDSVFAGSGAPPVQITDFRVFNKSIVPHDELKLSYANNYVTIEFAAMDYRNPAANRYMYKLEGIDRDWVVAGGQRSVSYATLAPGRYRFLVKGAGSDGKWNETPAEIRFTIKTPWWRTAGFFTGLGILVFSLFYFFYRFRIRQLEKVYGIRTKISQDLHDEVGATLTSISYLSEVAKQQKTADNGFQTETLEKIGEYSREMIGEMNDIVWAINPAHDRFETIERRMHNFASTLLSAKNMSLDFQSDPAIRSLALGMRQRKNLYLIFKEAVNNAAKYSGGMRVSVKVKKEDHHIVLDVVDDGQGFDVEAESRNGGNGLANMRSRAAEVDATLQVISAPGTGTRVSLALPITQNAY